MQKGNIGVTTENIFPVIKKFLYSDHDIFLRELVSNAVDATQKLKTLSSVGEFKGELGELAVRISIDGDKLIISDNGIGMTEEEIDKYINQIAFSGANDFLDKYKNDENAIIGHFGLGFYSAFMVAEKVEVITKSYKENTEAVKWSCDGSPSYELEKVEKEERGTEIILHIDDDSKEFLEKTRITNLLDKYCKFLPVSVVFGKKTEWKEGKEVETGEDNVVNNTHPIWNRKPSELKDEDYKAFYRTLYPMGDEPLFWIHLNVDYPFNLTGVLYFPKIKSNLDLNKSKIQLYCNQVYVTDSVEGIVPDFLTLLHGVIDSPDIPLNVSRSYLQNDANVRKISSYITKKVSDRLQSIFKSNRSEFEQKWDDIKLFINYGMLSEENYYDKAQKYALLKDTDGKYYTYEEYKTLINDNQTDKEGNLIYLYTTQKDEQYSAIEMAKAKGYNVLIMDGQLDVPVISMLEQKLEKSRFTRVDSDVIDRLIVKENHTETVVDADDQEAVSSIFKSQLPQLDKIEFTVTAQALGETSQPAVITQSEYMRRMKDMSAIQQGMGFYGEMPDMFTLAVNVDHKLVKEILEDQKTTCGENVNSISEKISTMEAEIATEKKAQESKKDEEISTEAKEKLADSEKELNDLKAQRTTLFTQFAQDNSLVHQLIDLSLLQNGMLKGEALTKFINRSVQMIKK
jgi:molecular chaperone HtpG